MALATRPKPKLQHKKRQAKHHRQGRQYLKTYWPYLPMLVIVGLGLAINHAWSDGAVLGAASDFSNQGLLTATNAQRASAHKVALVLDPHLSAAATAKAKDMVTADYWAHTSPDGRKTPWSFITASGYQYQTAGENLAYGFASSQDVIVGWMSSASHRANLLNNNYRQVGFGIASSLNYRGQGPETVVVAEYGQPLDASIKATTIKSQIIQTEPVLPQTTQPISRLQLLTNNPATWSLAAVSALSGAALALFIAQHGLRLRRVFVKGEVFIIHHPLLDIASVLVFTAGFLLTRTSGLIR